MLFKSRPRVPGMLLHDFRRTAVRNLERAGVSRSVAQALVGHETESIYARYAITNEQDLKDGVAKLAHLGQQDASRTVHPLRKKQS
jgi:integrase